MQPDCLKLAPIVQKCKFKISVNVAHTVINREGGNAFNTSFTHGGIGAYGRLSRENAPHIYKPNGWLWKMASGQVVARSLEWIDWWGFLNMAEFNIKKGPTGLKDKTLIIDKDGSLRTSSEYGQIPPDQNSQKLGGLPYFLKSPEFAKSFMFPMARAP